MIQILGGQRAQSRRHAINGRPTPRLKAGAFAPGTYGGNSYSSGGGFFDFIFGGGPHPTPIYRQGPSRRVDNNGHYSYR